MYNMMQNNLPAPYHMNPLSHESFLKRGGRAKTSGYATVHMNPHEISIMEHLQGHSRYNKEGVKEFRHLEELLKNPHILQSSHHHARAHHADGGPTHEEIEHLRQGGRFGDSTLASIGPNTQHFFNQLSGGGVPINPYTGHPEYWSMGNALRGLWGTVKNVGRAAAPMIQRAMPVVKDIARTALPAVLPAAQEYLGNKFGNFGQAAGQALGNAATNAVGSQEGPGNPYSQALGTAIGRGVESYRGGASPTQAFGQAVSGAGSHLGGGFGGAMEGMGQSIGAGNSARNILRSGAQSGFNAMGGREGVSNMASNIAHGFGSGGFGGARTAARQQLTDYRNRALPQMPMAANQDSEPYPEYPGEQAYG